MKYHNVQLQDNRDATLFVRPDVRKQNMDREEYLPLLALGVLLAGLLLDSLFG